ncbi:MAG: transposase [Oscillospiraceae bacterium]|nr:transposase [Oscillospiraceae bacterium]
MRIIFGKLFADRGYISSKLFEKFLEKNITFVTRAKKNMKNKLMDLYDRLMLRKRTVIECVNDFLKNICDIEHHDIVVLPISLSTLFLHWQLTPFCLKSPLSVMLPICKMAFCI